MIKATWRDLIEILIFGAFLVIANLIAEYIGTLIWS